MGGVNTTPSRTRNTFSPLPSETFPSEFSSSASSYPLLIASILAITLLRYCPHPLATGTKAAELIRRHEDTPTRMPFRTPSSPRYAPHLQAAMAVWEVAPMGLRPIAPSP